MTYRQEINIALIVYPSQLKSKIVATYTNTTSEDVIPVDRLITIEEAVMVYAAALRVGGLPAAAVAAKRFSEDNRGGHVYGKT